MYSLLITNGTVLDGTGAKPKKADVAIKDGRIAAVGDLKAEKAERTIDARGMYVTPGFIDVHNMSDVYGTLMSDPSQESMLKQGITSIIGGNCGCSLAPLTEGRDVAVLDQFVGGGQVNIDWLTVAEYFDVLGRHQLGVNYGTLVGHATLREGVVGRTSRDASSEERAVLANEIKKSLSEGALGLSFGLAYAPSNMVSTQELVYLAKVVAEGGGVTVLHQRSESREADEATKEVVAIGRESGGAVQISHFKVKEESNWPKLDKMLDTVKGARENGVRISVDAYPYSSTASVLSIYLPDWAHEGSREEMLARLHDKRMSRLILQEIRERGHDYSKMIIAIAPFNQQFVGKSIQDIAEGLGLGVEEMIIEVLKSTQGQALVFNKSISEENIARIYKEEYSMVGSDGIGLAGNKPRKFLVHPRSYGAYPRFLARYVREKKILSWESAINKCTGLPAEKFQLEGRGIIRENAWADIVVFDPGNITDVATYDNPYQYSKGIKQVVVNGQVAVDGNKITGVSAGTLLKRNG